MTVGVDERPAVPVAHLIDGELVSAAADWPVLDPSTGGEIARAPLADEATVERAVQAARRAFPGWSSSTPRDRGDAMTALADTVHDRSAEFAALESQDVGKPISAARQELPDIIDALRFFAGAGRCLPAPAAGQYVDGRTSMVAREPLGVVGLLTPWNYPLMTACWKLGAALAAGNTVVLKPSEETPLSAALLAQLAGELLPAGVVNVVFGRGEVAGRALVGNPAVAMLSLTGGTATGRAVATSAASTLQRLSLELGGNAPAIVLEDADLGAAAEGIATAAFANAGQDCTAAARVIADARVASELAERLAERARQLRIGPASDPETELGPLVSAAHRDRVARLVDSGGRILCGGSALEGDGFFFAPTVVHELGPSAEVVCEEVFGPVVTVQSVQDTEEALVLANSVSQALAASVWSEHVGHAMEVARRVDAGVVWINDHMIFASEMPHAGRGASGYGADLSLDAVVGFTATKHVMVRRP